jgi:protein-serine/threonine kinase
MLFDSDDNVVLVDFGLSTEFSDGNDCVRRTEGSVQYFAPEIVMTGVKNKEVKARRTDVWAMGVTLFNMATNRLPFDAMSYPGIKN